MTVIQCLMLHWNDATKRFQIVIVSSMNRQISSIIWSNKESEKGCKLIENELNIIKICNLMFHFGHISFEFLRISFDCLLLYTFSCKIIIRFLFLILCCPSFVFQLYLDCKECHSKTHASTMIFLPFFKETEIINERWTHAR